MHVALCFSLVTGLVACVCDAIVRFAANTMRSFTITMLYFLYIRLVDWRQPQNIAIVYVVQSGSPVPATCSHPLALGMTSLVAKKSVSSIPSR